VTGAHPGPTGTPPRITRCGAFLCVLNAVNAVAGLDHRGAQGQTPRSAREAAGVSRDFCAVMVELPELNAGRNLVFREPLFDECAAFKYALIAFFHGQLEIEDRLLAPPLP